MFVTRARRASIVAISAVLTVLAAHAAESDEPVVSIQPRARPVVQSDIRVSSNLVLIPVSVTDARNHPVTGLTSDKFRVFDGKAEQKVLRLSSDDAPVSVGIVFDTSGSMADKLAKAREAVSEFLRTANPEDEFFLLTFNSATNLAVPFTTDAEEIQAGLMNVPCRGRTALLDAIHESIHYLKSGKNPRKALLIISDGGDNRSRYSETEIRRAVRESQTWIYALGIYSRRFETLPEEEGAGEKLLTEIAEETGGREYAVDNLAKLPETAAKIGLQLRNQYVLAYSPSNIEPDGKYRRVHVKLAQKEDMNLSWRSGYYAPVR